MGGRPGGMGGRPGGMGGPGGHMPPPRPPRRPMSMGGWGYNRGPRPVGGYGGPGCCGCGCAAPVMALAAVLIAVLASLIF